MKAMIGRDHKSPAIDLLSLVVVPQLRTVAKAKQDKLIEKYWQLIGCYVWFAHISLLRGRILIGSKRLGDPTRSRLTVN